jgi:hypothetical protein
MRDVLQRVIVSVLLAASAAAVIGVSAPSRGKVLLRSLSMPVNAGEYTCTQDQKEYKVGATICINHTPFRCVENRGWVKVGTSC